MSRVIILGSTGMLGSAVVAEAVREGLDIIAPSSKECNLYYSESVFEYLKAQQDVSYLINCVGLVPHRNPTTVESIKVNAQAPYAIAQWAEHTGVKVIHVSTDCVFSGKRRFNSLNSVPDPVDIYGRTKCLGEVKSDSVANIRTSFIGLGEYGFVNWLISSKAIKRVRGWDGAMWTGSTTYEIARFLIQFIKNNIPLGNIEHLATEHPITKFQLAMLVNAYLNLGLEIIPVEEPCINRALVPTIAITPIGLLMDELAREYNRNYTCRS